MNREFKFRAWKKSNKQEMLTCIKSINWVNRIVENLSVNGNRFRIVKENFDNIILMQYTGSKDMNGVDIYEGDIYKYKYYFNSESYEYRYSVVEWRSSEIDYEGVFHGYEFNESYIEVVGNIYENPELLQEDN